MESKWRDREIVIDGNDAEWRDCRMFYDQESRLIVGIYNDEKYLYLRLTSRDPDLQEKIMRSGLTVWFDPNGKKKRSFGINFPLGMRNGEPANNEFEKKKADCPHDNRDMARTGEDWGKRLDFTADIQPKPGNMMKLIGPEEDDLYFLLLEEVKDIKVCMNMNQSERNLIYELMAPLTYSSLTPNAIGVGKEGIIAVGFETGKEVEREMMQNRGHMGMPPSGGPGGKMEGGSGMGGPSGGISGMQQREGFPPGKKGNTVEPHEIWLKVKLASGKEDK